MALNWGGFAPRGHLGMSGDIFCWSKWGRGRGYWNLVGRDQGCCLTSHNAQDGPTTMDYPTQNIESAVAEKP